MDVHTKTVVACLLTARGKELRKVGPMTADLLELIVWLREQGCQQVARESTGSDGQPISNLLEAEGLPASGVHAQHSKAGPGRKTDVKDAQWMADLLRPGLVGLSFIPKRELAGPSLIRYRPWKFLAPIPRRNLVVTVYGPLPKAAIKTIGMRIVHAGL